MVWELEPPCSRVVVGTLRNVDVIEHQLWGDTESGSVEERVVNKDDTCSQLQGVSTISRKGRNGQPLGR